MNKLKHVLSNSPKLQIVLIVLLTIVIYWCVNAFLFIRFEANDDIAMALFASGSYSGMPNEHLVFINFIFGFILKFLYQFNSSIEWYTYSFLALQILSVSIIVNYISSHTISKFMKVCFALVCYTLSIRLLILLQFTTTAAMVATAGLLLTVNSKRGISYMGIVLIIIASLIRFNAAMLVVLMASPVFIIDALKNKVVRIKYAHITLAISLCFCLGAKLADTYYYQHEQEWKDYVAFNAFRGKINDNPNNDISTQLPDDILPADYTLLVNFFANPQAIDLPTVQKIYGLLEKPSLYDRLLNVISEFRRTIAGTAFLVMIATLIFLFAEQRLKIIPVLIVCNYLVIFIYLSSNAFVKPRVFLSALYPVVMLLPFIYNENVNIRKTKLLPVASVIVSLLFVYQTITISKESEEIRDAHLSEQQDLIDKYLNQENHHLIPFKGYSVAYFNIFNISNLFYSGQMHFSGWLTQSPYNYSGFSSFKKLIDGSGMIISNSKYDMITQLIRESISHNNHVDVTPVIIEQSEQYMIIEFRK
ncbi:MAG: hypothetical protein MI866_23755 [Bacteroidales bacterium]|nr:hypothetical protein [Bacteroidales bacterium]